MPQSLEPNDKEYYYSGTCRMGLLEMGNGGVWGTECFGLFTRIEMNL